MKTTIIVQNDMVIEFKRTINKIFSDLKYKMTHSSNSGTYFEIEFDDPAVLFYLGINCQVAYELSDERFFRNKFKQ